MKIVKAKEMARIEQLAYAKGVSEEAFMNQAGIGVAECIQHFIAEHHLKPKFTLLCGRGNNAGDAYVAGTILHKGGFHVRAFALAPLDESSSLCQLQAKRFLKDGGIIEYPQNTDSLSFGDSEVIVDGILGTGFHGKLEGIYRDIIEEANSSKIPIISIDIPSGVNGNNGEFNEIAIQASQTLSLGLPKSGCFIGDAWNFIGRLDVYDFGLGAEFIDQADPDFILIDKAMTHRLLPPIVRNRHKYQTGYVVGLGGSLGMPGAPIMASFSSLRAGAGIVRLLHPEGMESVLASAPYEVVRQSYKDGDGKTVLTAMEKASATFVGPGMSTSPSALKMLKRVLPQIDRPCVIDADALTLLAENPIPLPQQTVITPHHGEMKRLLGVTGEISFPELLKRSQEYAEQKKITLVLKGAPTFVLHPDQKPHLCARGDPGMATAGSGDVLTGMIAGLLAQTHDPFIAALLGVQLHAIAGEYAAQEMTSYSMTAMDISDALPEVFRLFCS